MADPLRLAVLPRLRRMVRQRLTLKQTSTLLGALGMIVVVVVTAFITANERRVLFAEAQDHAEQSAAYLADHAQRLFEVSDILLHTTGDTLGTTRWDEVGASQEILAAMRRIDNLLPYVDSVFAADREGNVRATTLDHAPRTYSIADRSVFKDAKAEPGDDLLVGEPIVGRVSGRPTFIVARRRAAADGGFDGLVGVAMTLDYFTDYWRTLDKRNDEQIALVRLGSGGILAHYPPAMSTADQAGLGAGLAATALDGARTGTFRPGPHSFGIFRRVGALPIAIAVVFNDAVITRQWHASLGRALPVAGATLLVLVAIMALAQRLARREDLARRHMETARAMLSANNARLEQRVVKRTADLMESNQEIQRFAYIVSHDLRAPLVNIMGFTAELQSLRDEVLADPARLDEAARARLRAEFDEAFGFIGSSIDKMDRLIKAILSLSRQGQRAFRPEPLDMDVLMRSVADGLAHRVQQSGATIAIEPLPRLVADRIAVEQVFANLLDNAVKYLRADVVGRIQVSGTASATTVTYTVKDNGRGIAAQDQERVFDLFRRAGKLDQPGEGIGLANVRTLVRRLQGTITLDSTLSLGCVFTVTLPQVGDTTGTE